MELYNESKKYIHANINELLAKDVTCIFTCKINSEINDNYKLIDKGMRGELFVILNKENRIAVYYGDKIKKQIQSSILEKNKLYHIIIVRSFVSKKNYIYINGKNDVVTDILNHNNLFVTDNKIKFLTGGGDYFMSKIRLYDYSISLKQVKTEYILDTKNKTELLKYISNRMDETMKVNMGIYDGFLLDDILILFTKNQMYLTQKNYPLDPFIKYNMEQQEQKIPQILSMLVSKTNDLNDHFNVDTFANNLVTWQIGMYESLYPKNIEKNNIVGYWIENEVTPFVPFTGKGLNYVSCDGKIVDREGTFQSGMFVSYIKLIIDNYLKTRNPDLLLSIHRTIDYLIDISVKYDNGGVPLYHPSENHANVTEEWKYNISMKNGNYINYLRTIEIILSSANLLSDISAKIEQLGCAYKKSLNLLLKLQINSGSTKTIWGQYYNKETFIPCEGNCDEPIGLCSLESAQILLYLMNFEDPTNNIKNAIVAGCNWFISHKITGWMQVFDKKSYDPSAHESLFEQQTMIIPYNYIPFPDKMILHSRYYSFDQNPIFKENGKYYSLESFNDMSIEHRNNELHIGMWGQYLLEIFNEWRQIHM